MKNKTVLVAGVFNILHPGHLRLLRFAREFGDTLIVAVLSDSSCGTAAHVHQNLRLEALRSNMWVSHAFICEESIIDVIKALKPDVVVKGKEHECTENPELAILTAYGGKLVFSSGDTAFSSLDLLRREILGEVTNSFVYPYDYMLRHNLTSKSLSTIIEKFRNLRVVVVGDLIVDEYVTCEPLGMSQEDPTIVVSPVDTVKFLGGAGIVAAHSASLGAEVTLFSVAGSDYEMEFSRDALSRAGVHTNLSIDASRPTTVKRRYRSKGKTLLRVNRLHSGSISAELQSELSAQIKVALESADLLVFSDFNYGCLPQKLVSDLLKHIEGSGLVTAADSQSSSQFGDICRYRQLTLITPTEREARIGLKNQEDGLVILAKQLTELTNAENVLLKLGEEGMLVHSANATEGGWVTDRLSALNTSPKDVAGAGDSVLISAGMTIAAGGNIWQAALIGSVAAAIQVGRVGNTPISAKDLLREVSTNDPKLDLKNPIQTS
jgi:rfaE bifunctional protein kinase chain/domain